MSEDAAVPRRIGPLRLLEPLGRGSLCAVHLAELVEATSYAPRGGRVAVKLLLPERAGEEGQAARLEREGACGRRLAHPAVARTFDSGWIESAGRRLPYLVLELVSGRSLAEHMRERGILPEPLLRHVARQVALGLGALHAAGLVHRDLKPENILLTLEPAVKLVDLGLAREIGGLPAPFEGSLHYAAPEQIQGAPPAAAADLYALGVVLYEAATDAQPFAAASSAEVVARQLELRPAPAGRLNPELSPFFAALLAALLEKDPALRPGSAAELAAILAEGESSAWWSERARRAAAAADPLARFRVRQETGFVGRGEPLARLLGALALARAGRGQVLALVGPGGSGKSRLLAELARRALEPDDGVTLLHAALPEDAPPGAAGSLGRALVDPLDPAGAARRLAELLGAPRDAIEPVARALLGADGGEEPIAADATRSVVLDAAAALAARAPVLWIAEDLDPALPSVPALLGALDRLARETRLLVIVTRREEVPEAEAAFPGLATLRLEPLSAGESEDLLRAAIDPAELPAGLAPRLVERAQGNPLFLLELVRGYRRAGRRAPSLTSPRPAVAGDIPASLRALLEGRLGRLAAADRGLLEAAAVEGVEFDPGRLAGTLGREPLGILARLAALAVPGGLLEPAGPRFRFTRRELPELLREGLAPERLAAQHGALARVQEERLASRLPRGEPLAAEEAIFLAEHGLASESPGRGLPHALRAATALLQRHQPERAIALVQRALAVHDRDDAPRIELLLLEIDVLEWLGRRGEKRAAAERAVAVAEKLADPAALARALQARGRATFQIGDPAGALADLERAAGAAERAGDPVARAEIDSGRGLLAHALGRHEEARAAFARAVAGYRRAGDRRREADMLGQLATLCFDRGELSAARSGFARCRRLSEAADYRIGRIRGEGGLGLVHSARGDAERALEQQRRARELSRGAASRNGEIHAALRLAECSVRRGRFGETRREIERARELNRLIVDPQCEWFAGQLAARLALASGDLAEAERQLEDCLRIARALGVRRFELQPHLLRGELELSRGDLERGRASFERALEMARASGVRRLEGEALLGLGQAQLAAGDAAPAELFLASAEALAARRGFGELALRARAWRAVLGALPAAAVVVAARLPELARAEAHALLHRAGAGQGRHARRARRLLEAMASELDEGDRERFRERSPVPRLLAASG